MVDHPTRTSRLKPSVRGSGKHHDLVWSHVAAKEAPALTGRIANATDWQDLGGGSAARRAGAAACASGAATFAAFLSGVAGGGYVPGALCLRRSLRAVGSACPIALVHDDRGAEVMLPEASLRELEQEYGAQHLYSLTGLMRRFPTLARAVRYNISTSLDHSVGRGEGRRLYLSNEQGGLGIFATHVKVWLLALPFKRVAVLDLDMVAVHNMDGLLGYPFPQELAATGCGFHGAHDPLGVFNSGLMLLNLSPPEAVARRLHSLTQRRAPHWRHHDKACEVKPGDQTLLNAEFARQWHRLPPSLVVPVHAQQPI